MAKIFNYRAIKKIIDENGPCCVDVDGKMMIPLSNIEFDGYCDMYLTFVPACEYFGMTSMITTDMYASDKRVELFFPKNGTRVDLWDYIVELDITASDIELSLTSWCGYK